MKAEKVINDKKKMIAVILALILVIVLCAGGFHLHGNHVKKKQAEALVSEVMTDLQKDQTADAEKLLGRKPAETLGIDAMSAKAYMKTIVQDFGYTTGNADQDAKASYTDLLQAGGADQDTVKDMKKLYQAFQDNGIVSYETADSDLKENQVSVAIEVKGIILLPKVSFAKEAQKANEKLADYVNKNMDDLIRTYNQADDDADQTMQSALAEKELDELIPAMTKRVKNTKKSTETWTFTVDVSADQAEIKDVKVQ